MKKYLPSEKPQVDEDKETESDHSGNHKILVLPQRLNFLFSVVGDLFVCVHVRAEFARVRGYGVEQLFSVLFLISRKVCASHNISDLLDLLCGSLCSECSVSDGGGTSARPHKDDQTNNAKAAQDKASQKIKKPVTRFAHFGLRLFASRSILTGTARRDRTTESETKTTRSLEA